MIQNELHKSDATIVVHLLTLLPLQVFVMDCGPHCANCKLSQDGSHVCCLGSSG